MRKFTKTNHVFEKLVSMAIGRNFIAAPDGFLVQKALNLGQEIPEHCLPGRLVMKLPAEERELLKKLKSEDVNYRW